MVIPTARDCMAKSYFTLQPDMDVFLAIDLLVKKQASGAPVVDSNRHLVGILTEKDCLRIISTSAYSNVVSGTVSEFMSEVKMAVSVGMDLFTVAQLFLLSNFPALPVVDNETLAGVITRQDVLRGIIKLENKLEAVRRQESAEMHTLRSPCALGDIQRLVSTHNREQLAAVFSSRHGPE